MIFKNHKTRGHQLDTLIKQPNSNIVIQYVQNLFSITLTSCKRIRIGFNPDAANYMANRIESMRIPAIPVDNSGRNKFAVALFILQAILIRPMDSQLQAWSQQFPVWAWNAGIVISSLLLGFIAKLIITLVLRYYQNKNDYSFFKSIITHLAPPLNFFMPLFALNLALPLLKFDKTSFDIINEIAEILIVIAFAGLLINAVGILEEYVYHRCNISDKNSLKARKLRTQVIFIKKVIIVTIVLVAISIVLLHFENFRKIGEGLLTGVGIGSVIIGFAAQKPLGNFLAGLQIAFTQPVRIDDVLLVEGEWGRVEDITLTYVVINTWDQRRLILPITYFCDKPFQNWTRTTSELLGIIFLYVDYTFPVDELRTELNRTVQTTELWDKRVATLLVTNAKSDTMELRISVSARNSSEAFALRCHVREHLIKYIAENMPQSLPQRRYKGFEDDPSKKNWEKS